jgi:hypothetical protein
MTTPQERRIEHLEARTATGRMIAFVAATTGTSPAAVIAEAERILRETAGLTDRERTERIAADLGRTPAEVEADLAEVAADFARWQGGQTP